MGFIDLKNLVVILLWRMKVYKCKIGWYYWILLVLIKVNNISIFRLICLLVLFL